MTNCKGHGTTSGKGSSMFDNLSLDSIKSHFPNIYEEEKRKRAKKKATKKKK